MSAEANILVLPERIRAKLAVQDDGCWVWMAHRNQHGYGMVWANGRPGRRVHRIVFELIRGPVPAGLELDHLCARRACANPNHLEAVTHAENVRRGRNTTKTQCAQGHPYDEANTYHHPRGQRMCRSCRRAYQNRWNARRRAA